MSASSDKPGTSFEELVTWINQCLHAKAVVTANDKIRDIHSNRLRQVDISIRLKDGPSEFLGIVEVRDRSRPVGEEYIEQVSSKRQSVAADAAFIVSSSGFYAAAIEKAKALNIRLFTYQEAVSSNWTQCLQLREITQFINRLDNLLLVFLDPSSNRIINPHPSMIEAIKQDKAAKIFLDESGEPRHSVVDIVNMFVNQNNESIYQGLCFVDPPIRKGFIVDLHPSPEGISLFFRDQSGQTRKLEKFRLVADFWVELRRTPVVVAKYYDAKTGNGLAEVASTIIDLWGGPHKLEFIAKHLGEDGEEGSQVLMRLRKQDETGSSPQGTDSK